MEQLTKARSIQTLKAFFSPILRVQRLWQFSTGFLSFVQSLYNVIQRWLTSTCNGQLKNSGDASVAY